MSLHDVFMEFGKSVDFLWNSDFFGAIVLLCILFSIILTIVDVMKRDRR